MFGTGTATVLQPVRAIVRDAAPAIVSSHAADFAPAGSAAGSGRQQGGSTLMQRLLVDLTDIQYGRTEHPWSYVYE